MSPVPTAVPPIASAYTPGMALLDHHRCAWSSCAAQPEITWPSVSGVASCRWVRPTITTSRVRLGLGGERVAQRVHRREQHVRHLLDGGDVHDGRERVVRRLAVVDVVVRMDRASSSRRRRRRAAIARFAITSLAFMLVCVPEPVWNTTSGNSSSSLPSITSCAALTMRSTFAVGSCPSSPLASAAHFFRMPSARITGRPQRKRSTPIGKLRCDRCVCAPHS